MASSISGWTEAILLSLAFLSIITLVIVNFNLLYDKDYSVGLTDSSDSEQLFIKYQETSRNQTEGSDITYTTDNGISVKSSYAMAMDAIKIVWSFLSGGWIENVAEMINLGDAGLIIAKTLRILYFLSLVFAILYALFKVVM